MASASTHRTMAVVFAFILLCQSGAAWSISKTVHNPPPQAVIEPNITFSEAMANVQHHIHNIERMPSCKKLASKHLVHSCQSYNGQSDHSTDEALDTFQKLFAIRMTYCELSDAQQEMPGVCQPLLAPGVGVHVPKKLLEDCLGDLFVGSSQWTTYTSIKTNGLVMCLSMRSEADKEESLEFYRALQNTMFSFGQALVVHKDDLGSLKADFHNLSSGMRDFYNDLHTDNEVMKSEMRASWYSLQDDMQDINSHVESLKDTMAAANAGFQDYSSHVGAVIEQTTSLSAQSTVQHAAELENIRHDFEQFRERFGFQNQQLLDDFHSKVFAAFQSVDVANDRTSDLASRLGEIYVGLDAPLTKIGILNTQADNLVLTQQDLSDNIVELKTVSQSTLEQMQTVESSVRDMAGFLAKTIDLIKDNWFMNSAVTFLSQAGTFLIWSGAMCATYFILFCVVLGMPWPIATVAALVCGVYMGSVFTFVHSPVTFAKSVYQQFPDFFITKELSILVVAMGASALTWGLIRVWDKVTGRRAPKGVLLGEDSEGDWENNY
ncbi:unnamed protein product [Zymoseptoria tritici ST99CH_3D7]|uniref:Karyogamy protein 5 n=1 Tax=Zymoseptoria tritici (strain ST99CH_3D7) TaxID=1276538 RepID=A0A1X7RR08_ZYMT9|nr:unnamed protein product [Zymoseptoria tritici ST99CH_3D7]